MQQTSNELTPIQLRTFRTIKRYMEEHGFPPTVGEVADILSKTKASIHANIDHLIQKGFIRRTFGKARSLEIVRLPQSDRHRRGCHSTPRRRTRRHPDHHRRESSGRGLCGSDYRR